jgi:hypothetical protein
VSAAGPRDTGEVEWVGQCSDVGAVDDFAEVVEVVVDVRDTQYQLDLRAPGFCVLGAVRGSDRRDLVGRRQPLLGSDVEARHGRRAGEEPPPGCVLSLVVVVVVVLVRAEKERIAADLPRVALAVRGPAHSGAIRSGPRYGRAPALRLWTRPRTTSSTLGIATLHRPVLRRTRARRYVAPTRSVGFRICSTCVPPPPSP